MSAPTTMMFNFMSKIFSLIPNAKHKEICGRRFNGEPRIVGGEIFGGIASYGEWPWQVNSRVKICMDLTSFGILQSKTSF